MIWGAKVTKVYELIQMPVQACAGMILLGRIHYICLRTSDEIISINAIEIKS
jgi:hypothetical protein